MSENYTGYSHCPQCGQSSVGGQFVCGHITHMTGAVSVPDIAGMHILELMAEVQRLHAELREASDVRTNILSGTIDLMRVEFEAKVAALEAENGRLRAPVSDAEWEQFAYDVRIATPTNFVHAKMMEFHQLDNLIATRAQQPSPAQDKEQG